VIEPGTKLAHYQVVSALGKGGMGEVWRARDTKLGREVAIKTLPAEFAQDADRLSRFEREAKLLASLNHPNIAAIHGFEEDDGTHFLVMELVEGDTLADRVGRGAIPVEESLKLALQIAEALEAAHEKGVIHRDLKPANIKVTPDNKIKVLDFGLAKAFAGDQAEANAANSPTLSMQATQQGMILGTAAYMSPEQASGEATDKRADIWAFGVVLFEMLTGRQVFTGKTVSHVMGAVLNVDPEWARLPGNLHPRIRLLLERCVEKDTKDRYSSIADARVDLEKVLASSDPRLQSAAEPVQAGAGRGRATIAAAILITAALTTGVVHSLLRSPAPGPVTRFQFSLSEGQEFTRPEFQMVAVSPDGTRMAFVANGQIHVRQFNELASRPVDGTDAGGNGVANPVFSPDGEWLAYTEVITPTESLLKRVPVTGGTPVTVFADGFPRGVSWPTPETIVFANHLGVVRVPSNGGEPEVLVSATEREVFNSPQILPDGDSVLFTLAEGDATVGTAGVFSGPTRVVAQSINGDDRTVVWEGGSAAKYLPTGHMVYAQGNTLFAIRFDPDARAVDGGQVPIVEGVRRSNTGGSDTANYSVSDTGTLVHIPDSGATTTAPVGVLAVADPDGRVDRLDLERGQYRGPRVSPDGGRIAVEIIGENQRSAIWVYDLSGRQAFRRLLGAGSNMRPIWTPDGERITFASDRDGSWGIYSQPADGSGAAELLVLAGPGEQYWPDSWSDGMRTLAFTRIVGSLNAIASQTIWTVGVDEAGQAGEPEALVPVAAGGASFSPSGEWIAYRSSNPAVGPVNQIHVQPFPATGAFYAVTEEGGSYPMWSRDGDQLLYRRPAAAGGTASVLARVAVITDGSFAWGDETVLPVTDFLSYFGFRDYDIMPDGERIVVNVPATVTATSGDAQAVRPQINVVMNWVQELLERVPVD
jgi:serine/threonine protein kinase/Tol biopolymer transport system component